MGHERKFILLVFIQYHGAVQPHTAIPTLPLRPHTAHTDCHWAWEKQPAKANHSSLDCEINHSSLADFDCEIRWFIHVALCSW